MERTVTGRAYTTGPRMAPMPRFPLDELRATWWLDRKPTATVYDREKRMLGVLLIEPPRTYEVGDTFRVVVDRPLALWPIEDGIPPEDTFIETVDFEVGPVWALHDERRLSFTHRRGDLDSLRLSSFWPLEKPFLPRPEILAAMEREQDRRDQRAVFELLDSLGREIAMHAAPPN